MKRNSYYPSRQADQVIWLTNFANKLPSHATVLGLAAGTVTAAVADCLWLIYVMQTWLPAARTWAQSCSDTAAEAQDGTGTAAMTLPVFTAPALPTGVTPVAAGALTRIFALVQVIRNSGKCTDAIARNLGIIGSEQAGPDMATLQPALSLAMISGQVLVKWNWQGYASWLESCEIQVDRGDGKGWVLLTIDTTPNYTDTAPLPVGQSALWKYRAIYHAGDARIGQWSETVSIPVAG